MDGPVQRRQRNQHADGQHRTGRGIADHCRLRDHPGRLHCGPAGAENQKQPSRNGDGRRRQAEENRPPQRLPERAVKPVVWMGQRQLRQHGHRQDKAEGEGQGAKDARRPAPRAGQAGGFDRAVPARHGMVSPATPGGGLQRQQSQHENQHHAGNLRRSACVGAFEPDVKDALGQRPDGEEIHRAEIIQRLHRHDGHARRDGGAGERDRDADKCAPRPEAKRSRRLKRAD